MAGKRGPARGREGQLRVTREQWRVGGCRGTKGPQHQWGTGESGANRFAHCRNGHNVNKVTIKELIIKNSFRGQRETLSI